MIDVLRRFAWARIVVIIACSLTSVATTLAQECTNRGQLDALYCDENNDLVADVPTDPKKLRDPSTLPDHNAVGEHRKIGARPDAAKQDCRTLPCIDVARELDCNFTWAPCVTAERAANRIENGALGYPYDIFRKVLVSQAGRIQGKRVAQRTWRSPTVAEPCSDIPCPIAEWVGTPAAKLAAATCFRK